MSHRGGRHGRRPRTFATNPYGEEKVDHGNYHRPLYQPTGEQKEVHPIPRCPPQPSPQQTITTTELACQRMIEKLELRCQETETNAAKKMNEIRTKAQNLVDKIFGTCESKCKKVLAQTREECKQMKTETIAAMAALAANEPGVSISAAVPVERVCCA